jgi:cytochrome b6-f complex iron-sulfur subunit
MNDEERKNPDPAADEPDRLEDSDDSGEPGEVSRREFFLRLGNTAVAVTILGGGAVGFRYLWPNVVLEPPARFEVGPLQEITPGSVVFDAKRRVFIFRAKAGYLYALSAVCTHLGCTTAWKPDGIPGHPEGVIACPCHGSIYSRKGDVLHGPAPRALDRFRLSLEDDDVYVNTDEKVDEDHMILRV